MLFKNTADLQAYTNLVNFNLATFQPTLSSIEEETLVPYLGDELYADLLSKNSEASLEEPYLSLLDKCKRILAGVAVYIYIPKGELQVSENGITRPETDTAKTAYGYQISNLRESYLHEAEVAIEQLLKFLWVNKATFNKWTESQAFTEYTSLIVRSGDEFKKIFSLQQTPYRNYWAMRSKMRDVQFFIGNSIGAEIMGSLISEYNSGTISESDEKLLYALQRAVVYQTIAESVPYLNCRIEANGLTVLSTSTTTKDNNNRTAASDPAVSNLIISAQQNASSWIDAVQGILNARNPPTNSEPVRTCSNNNYNGLFSL